MGFTSAVHWLKTRFFQGFSCTARSEVDDFGDIVAIKHDIGRFNISMANAQRIKPGQPICNLPKNIELVDESGFKFFCDHLLKSARVRVHNDGLVPTELVSMLFLTSFVIVDIEGCGVLAKKLLYVHDEFCFVQESIAASLPVYIFADLLNQFNLFRVL